MRFCEAVVNETQDGVRVPIVRICAKPATHRVHGNLQREYWVCDQHQKDFAPKHGETIRIGVV